MNFEQLILYEREELEEEEARQDFLWFYHVMMEAKKHIAEEINANIEIQRIPYHEMGSVLQDQYAWKYMPGIVWFDDDLRPVFRRGIGSAVSAGIRKDAEDRIHGRRGGGTEKCIQ